LYILVEEVRCQPMCLSHRLKMHVLHPSNNGRGWLNAKPFGHKGHHIVCDGVLAAVPIEVAGDPLNIHLVMACRF
jgi:hypothetical protein